ncbi:MAG: DNA-formamidopyrimidine glycosylase [Nodosilinea sp.]
MPELPEVETVCRGLNRVTLNLPIQSSQILLSRSLAYPTDTEVFCHGVTGKTLKNWQRRGKYLLAELIHPDGAAGGYLGVHLRMTGQLLWLDPATPLTPHCRVRLFLGPDRELRFIDQRTFGRIWWIPPDHTIPSVITGLQRLGPEPFDPGFNPAYLKERLQGSQRPIKNALIDQHLVAGIGNIYADEALFLSGIRPPTPAQRLGLKRLTRLYESIQSVLTTSIESGGTSFSDYRDIYGINGNYGGVAWVYDREGLSCRVCQTPIQRLKLAGRSAHYCPRCQR